MTTIKRLSELEQAATSGKWTDEAIGSEGWRVMGEPRPYGRSMRRPRLAALTNEDWDTDKANAALIAETRTLLPAILRCLEAARELYDAETEWLTNRNDANFARLGKARSTTILALQALEGGE